MRVKYQVALTIEIEADVEIDGNPETGLEPGECTQGDLDPDNPIHSIMMSAVAEQVIAPALLNESGEHNDAVVYLSSAAQGLLKERPNLKAELIHCVGLEESIPPIRII